MNMKHIVMVTNQSISFFGLKLNVKFVRPFIVKKPVFEFASILLTN